MSMTDIEKIKIAQGRKVLLLIQSEAWEILENIFKAKKILAEKDRKRSMRLQSTRENCLYWSGVVDGVNEVIDDILRVVEEAKEIEAREELLQKYEEEETPA